MTSNTGQKSVYLICFAVISVAVVGYFVGLQAPMNPAFSKDESADPQAQHAHLKLAQNGGDSGHTILATHYTDMPAANIKRAAVFQTNLIDLKPNTDPLAEFTITPSQKTFALALRDQNRAFNGAPPTIPHSVEQMPTTACIACHGEGVKTETLRISKMSHQFLANCTQCHVENNPERTTVTTFGQNSFVGLPAPTAGPRAFVGAPPMIPHSTWMRVNCDSCHGLAGEQGIRSTHPWRQNCQQCHAPSSELDQTQLETQPKFLEPLKIK